MKKILTTAFSLGVGLLSAQNVGIGTATPNASAKLEIVDANRGILLPRVSLTATNIAAPVTAPANWLMVFNTNISAPGPFAVTQGLYYWDGTQWVKFQASNANDWTVLGNAGTVDGTNFIGTTDNVPFNVRVNNTQSGRIDQNNANTFWGYRAGLSNSTGSSNTAVGQDALRLNTTGRVNTALGGIALQRNTTGINNTAIGGSALSNNTIGDFNTGLGVSTLENNTSGSLNTALGNYAMVTNTSGAGNTAVGNEALKFSSTASNNTAIGVYSMFFNTTGIENTASGQNSMFSNTTGNNNTAIGAGALSSNTTASHNTAIGRQSLRDNSTGYDNTGVGVYTLLRNTTGYNNVAVGDEAMSQSTTGYQNVALGEISLRNNTTGFNTVAIGRSAGLDNGAGNNNSFLGAHTNASTTNLTNATAVGANVTVTQSNTVILGSNANVGIGTTTPTDRLQVANGNTRIGEVNAPGSGAFPNAGRELYFSGGVSSGPFNSDNSDPLYMRRFNQANDQTDLQIVIGDNGTSPNNDRVTIGDLSAQRISLAASGHVGINTLLPATNLHVVGSTRLEQNAATLQLAGTAAGHSYIEYYSQGMAAGRQGYVGFPSNGSTDFNFYNENAAGNINLSTPFNGIAPELSVRANGNVGIGTAAPTSKLHLENGQFQQRTTTDVSHSLYMNNTASNRGWQLYHLGSTDANAPNGFMFEYFNGTSWARRMTIAQGGQVGINTNTFSSIFNVQGNVELQNVNDNMLLSRNDANARNLQLIGSYMGWDQRGIYLGGYNQNNLSGSFSDANRVYCGGSFGSIPITATAFTVASSQRYKQNIIPTVYGLSSVMQLRAVQYQYNFDKLGQTHVGLIAEEVNKVIPEIVVKQDEKGEETKDVNGKTMGVNYSELVPVLIKAMQEQQQQIENQQQQIQQLQQQIENLNKK